MISSFIERARRRFVWNEALGQTAFAGALLLGGVIVLLLAGTQLLDWWWLPVVASIGAGVGVYRTWRRVPTAYRVAVLVDARAGLHDALSTALHFSEAGTGRAGLPAIREFQKQQAERLIPSVNLETAVPFRMPRALYFMGALGLVASGLFALRYGIRRTLDFQAPLSQVVMDGLGLHAPEDKLAAARKKAEGKKPESLDEEGNPIPRSQEKRDGELDAAPPSALATVSDPDVNNDKQSAAGKEERAGKGEGKDKEGGEKGGAEQSENGQQAAAKDSAENPAGSKEGSPQGEPGASQQSSQGQNSSLLSKMKEAMQNLMSKAQPQANQAGQKPNGARQQKGQSQQAKQGEKGSPGESKEGGQQEQSEGQGQQSGDQDNSDAAQGKGNSKSSEQQAAAQPGSGVGKQDGAKEIRAAEQKAAMGKLTEIIGKRSANVSGEMMMESQSGPQQLRTQYSRRSATHGETGGEVNRDEVPVELQDYVQQYFQEVRKQERAGGPASGKAGGKPAPAASEPK